MYLSMLVDVALRPGFVSQPANSSTGFMKTTPDLPDELMREMKLCAVIQGRTLGAGGLSVIRCRADAPAAQMHPQDLLTLEQQTQTDEDMGRASCAV